MEIIRMNSASTFDAQKYNANLDILNNKIINLNKQISAVSSLVNNISLKSKEEMDSVFKTLSGIKNSLVGDLLFYQEIIDIYKEAITNLEKNNNDIKLYLNELGNLIINSNDYSELVSNMKNIPSNITNELEIAIPSYKMALSPENSNIIINQNNTEITNGFLSWRNKLKYMFDYSVSVDKSYIVSGNYENMMNTNSSQSYVVSKMNTEEKPYENFMITININNNNDRINGIHLRPFVKSQSKTYKNGIGEYAIQMIVINGDKSETIIPDNKRVISMQDVFIDLSNLQFEYINKIDIYIIQPNNYEYVGGLNYTKQYVYDAGFYFIGLIDKDSVVSNSSNLTINADSSYIFNSIKAYGTNNSVELTRNGAIVQNGDSISKGDILDIHFTDKTFDIYNIVIFGNPK